MAKQENKLTKEERETLGEGKLLLGLTAQRGWTEVLKPYLEDRRTKSFPDPVDFKTQKEFTHAALSSSAFKKVIQELLHYLEVDIPEQVKTLEKKEKGELVEKDFGIGRG